MTRLQAGGQSLPDSSAWLKRLQELVDFARDPCINVLMNMVTVATFNEPAKAEPLKERFAKAGIHAEIHDESKFEWTWFVSKPLAAFRLKVHKRDFETAHRLMNEWHTVDGALRDAICCPQCGHSRIEYPQFTRKFLMPNLVSLASVVGIIDREFYCQECGHTWATDIRQHPPRKHSAPVYFIEEAAPVPTSTTLLTPNEHLSEAPKTRS
jgi:hypothetical protein